MDHQSLSKTELVEELSKLQRQVSTLEADRAASRARLDDLVHSNPAVIYVCKVEGDFGATFVSDNMKKMLGWEPGA